MSTHQKILLLVIIETVILISGLFVWFYLSRSDSTTVPADTTAPADVTSSGATATTVTTAAVTDYRELPERTAALTTVASGLDAPWGFVWLPSGALLVTERFGTLRLVQDGELSSPIQNVPAVLTAGQGGLLDVTIHPDFASNRWVYLSFAAGTEEANRLRVVRGELRDLTLENVTVIFETAETKSGSQHFGSRFAWLPDQTLLVSVGDGGNPPISYNGAPIREQAQNLTTHLGKVIRLTADGGIPADNPFVGRPDVRPEIYSYGHRNVQGLTYDPVLKAVLASEHGSKGGDELNRLTPGTNYGWPLTTYSTEYDAFSTEIGSTEVVPGTQGPLIAWTPTVAPSQLLRYTGSRYGATAGDLFVSAMLLRSNATIAAYSFSPPGALLRVTVDEAGVPQAQEQIVIGDVRVRSVSQGPDGYLYVLTDATGRQSRPGQNAGAIVRVESF